VKVHRTVKLEDVPARAKRKHPVLGMEQMKTTYVLDELLKPDRPKDALAYIAFTSSDLYPQDDWNYVFGQASLRDRTGVWSLYRNGDPAESDKAFLLCLRRTLSTASHETGHILTIQHCIANECNMNGANNLPGPAISPCSPFPPKPPSRARFDRLEFPVCRPCWSRLRRRRF
jgi:archaemetzincin